MSVFSGVWTYRSLLNTPDAVGDFGKLAVWEAELYLNIRSDTNDVYGHLGERPEMTNENHPYLIINGTYSFGSPERISFRATGVEGTAFEGWIYDYEGFLSPSLPGSTNPVSVITGTVIRTVEHGRAPAGSVFAFVAVKQSFQEPREITSVALPDRVLTMLSSERHRLHHQLWHAARDEWNELSDAKKDDLRLLGWQPGPKTDERYSFGPEMFNNSSGEDFLFMHRRMIKMVREHVDVSGWRRLPRPRPISSFDAGFADDQVGNPDGFAIPDSWIVPEDVGRSSWLEEVKMMSTFQSTFRDWESRYTDSEYLSSVTLGELGARIEWTIHNWMHMRWASVPKDPETGLSVAGGRATLDYDQKWFSPQYDFLGETLSSHVNPIFWFIHGWVDNRIDDWFQAQENLRPGIVKKRTLYGVEWFESDGEWVNLEEPWEAPVVSGSDGKLDLDPKIMKLALNVIFGPEPTGSRDMAALEADVGSTGPARASWFKNVEI